MKDITKESSVGIHIPILSEKRKIEGEKKKERGITLVALVVTIVVLLILAGITIATLFGDNGIIKKAQKAKDETEQLEKEETKYLNKTEKDMQKAINGYGWKQNSDGTITDGEIVLKIGDYVDYNCKTNTESYISTKEKTGYDNDQIFKSNEYQYGWRVMGVDKDTKQLQLISEDFVPLTGGGSRGNRENQYYYLKGQEGYENGVDELNKICSIYGKGEGATGARTVNVDDINWITGYNPNNVGVKDKNKTGSGTKCYQGQIYEYENTVEYKLLSTGVQYTSKGNSTEGGINTKYKQFTYYDEKSGTWKSLEVNGNVTLKSSQYNYYPTTLTEINDINVTVGIARTSEEYKMLFTNSSTGADTANSGKIDNIYYWLGSLYVIASSGFTNFGVHNLSVGQISYSNLYNSYGNINAMYYGVRPVVTLNSKAMLKDSGTMKNGCKLYNLVH